MLSKKKTVVSTESVRNSCYFTRIVALLIHRDVENLRKTAMATLATLAPTAFLMKFLIKDGLLIVILIFVVV